MWESEDDSINSPKQVGSLTQCRMPTNGFRISFELVSDFEKGIMSVSRLTVYSVHHQRLLKPYWISGWLNLSNSGKHRRGNCNNLLSS